ncbi:MAG: outer membrane protein assembly factor BamA [Gallionella sp.]|nr:outer membrane protein assembly factor BamA [Gallionella sp.]NCS75002.1 outer membrane protein assembly factor BamA [Gallionella sp.]PIR09477.1 MAG: outer membrane protein assembly factor BamA [Gallionellaceae bacterium CG11_big_fil_rev_8_21_14_0_20_60_62]PJC04575.1 MAG: outer membrane protein assembly factor BamA [Gallionellaceae bacterium CG_4_9_14_0_8_um_filter_60_335]
MDLKKLAGVWALFFGATAWAGEPFVVKDIRVEGIQRTEAGTVFSYLPLKVGDTVTDERATAALHALFSTGFFKDVQLLADQGVLVVRVQERPTIASVELNGIKDFPKPQLLDNLKLVGLAEGRIFDKAMLEKSEQELTRQYIARGKYAVAVTTSVTELERNRVAVKLDVTEGDPSKIRQINFVGNTHYRDKTLLGEMKLTTPGMFTWLTNNDQYSKPKLEADMEAIRSLYLNSGYMDFSIDSTQVSISADKKDIYITLNITEGEPYTVSELKMAVAKGEFSDEELRGMIDIRPGQTFSRQALTEASDKIREELGDKGYAFANISAIPDIDKDTHQVAFTFMVDPMQRAYVRRINVTGNDKTKDEVVRREFRQMEGGWFSTSKIKKSKQRLDRLGFFGATNVETQAVSGSSDQLDLNLSVEEKPTGNFQIGAGFSNGEGITLLAGVTQSNLFGTGNSLSTQINTSKINQTLSVSYTNPYYTDNGISRGFDAFRRRTDGTTTSISQFTSETYGGGVRFGVPVNDDESFQYGLSLEDTNLALNSNSPQQFIDYVNTFGTHNQNVLGTIGWTRDTRDSAVYATEGETQRAFLEASLPVSGQRFYKFTYIQQWFYPLTKELSLRLNGDLGVAGGYSGMELPFFKNLFAGGTGSVRGYDLSSLGPRDINNNSLGGTKRVVGNIELLFPIPGMEKNRSVRLSAFIDGGALSGKKSEVPASMGMRYSAGVGLNWFSPAGPLQFSWAKPLNDQPQDKVQNFQFTLGGFF